MTEEKSVNEILREPFPDSVVGKLPRITCPDCRKSGSKVCGQHQKSKCSDCGAWITEKHMHLDYVGHAAVTDRLLAADPAWNWEPVAFSDDGTPLVTTRGQTAKLWIKLTIGGVTRLGVGTCGAGKDDVEKELIGDAIRNAAMRFGVALDLWSKEPLSNDDGETAVEVEPLTDEELESFEASIHFAETMKDLREVGKSIQARKAGGEDRERLMAAFKIRQEEIQKEEQSEIPV